MASPWVGKKFIDWSDQNECDTRKIHYRINGTWNGESIRTSFTSEDCLDSIWIFRILFMTINYIKLEKNEWYIGLNN